MRCRKTRSLIIRRIKHEVKKFRLGFLYQSLGKAKISNSSLVDAEENLKEGYFSVLTIELKKFQVELYYLRHPPFVKLLEEAAQEFGFDQPGVLLIPCEATELQRILS